MFELPKNRKDLYQVSCDLGTGTEWCTASGKYRFYFDNYIEKDSLFIFIKDNEKYQFHYKENMFMNKNDISIVDSNLYNLFEFINEKYPNYKIPIIAKIKANKITDEDYTYANEDDWYYISVFHISTEDFIRKYQHKLNWLEVSKYQKLSEDLIREFQDNVNWYIITVYQKISESFIREFQDKLYWKGISKNQKLSLEFIKEFKDKFSKCYTFLMENEKITNIKHEIEELFSDL